MSVGTNWAPAKTHRSYFGHLKWRPPMPVAYSRDAHGIDDHYDAIAEAEQFYAERARNFGFIPVGCDEPLINSWAYINSTRETLDKFR